MAASYNENRASIDYEEERDGEREGEVHKRAAPSSTRLRNGIGDDHFSSHPLVPVNYIVIKSATFIRSATSIDVSSRFAFNQIPYFRVSFTIPSPILHLRPFAIN